MMMMMMMRRKMMMMTMTTTMMMITKSSVKTNTKHGKNVKLSVVIAKVDYVENT